MDPKGAAGGRPRTALGPVCASLSPSVMRICSAAHVGRARDLCWVVHDSDDGVCLGREDAQVHRAESPREDSRRWLCWARVGAVPLQQPVGPRLAVDPDIPLHPCLQLQGRWAWEEHRLHGAG